MLVNALETFNSLALDGNNVTLSFYAKRGADTPSALTCYVYWGTGTDQSASLTYTGWTGATFNSQVNTLTTTSQKFTFSTAIPSNATQVAILFDYTSTGTAGANEWVQIEKAQLEIGSVATPFSRAGGSIGGELASCQRYYIRYNGGSTTGANYQVAGNAISSTTIDSYFQLPVTLRSTPSSIDFTNLGIYRVNNGTIYNSGGWYLETSSTGNTFSARYIHGSAVFTQGTDSTILVTGSNGASYLGFSAEL